MGLMQQKLLEETSVYDDLTSASAENEADKLATKVKVGCEKGGCNITKFVGNTKRIINSIPQEHRDEKMKRTSHWAKTSYPSRER